MTMGPDRPQLNMELLFFDELQLNFDQQNVALLLAAQRASAQRF